MINEEGPVQPQNEPEVDPNQAELDLSTPHQDLRLNCQAYTALGQDKATGKIQIEADGKLIGRNKKPVPATEVFKLAAIGMKDIEIAEWFGVDGNTLRYHFSVELLKGRNTLVQSLRRKQIEVAMGGNPTMLIFLGKNLLGQSDSPLATQEAKILPWEDE